MFVVVVVVVVAAAAAMMSVEERFFSGSSHVHGIYFEAREYAHTLLVEVILKFVRVSPQFLSLFLDFSVRAPGGRSSNISAVHSPVYQI